MSCINPKFPIESIDFIISRDYKLIIPLLDVNKCNIDLFDNNILNEWIEFINSFDDEFEKSIKKIKNKKYKTIEKNNFLIKIPYNYNKSIWFNYPDLYNCSGDKVLLYLEKTKYKLSDIMIRTSPSQTLVDCNITPETFQNLSISNYSKLTQILIENEETNVNIWCAIACWWNYLTDTHTQSILVYEPKRAVPTWIETNQIDKKIINNIIINKNDDILIQILNTYCCEKIFKRCNWFLMMHARAIINNSTEILCWINNNIEKIVWDADLLSDTPSYAFNECYEYYNNEFIIQELGKRFIN